MKKYSGIIIPLVTPFTKDGHTDRPAVEKLVAFITKHGCQPLALGTTGEAASLSEADKLAVIETMAKFKRDGIMLYACISDNCLDNMIERAKQYAEKGIDAVVAHLPSYYPLSAAAMKQWFEKLADESPLPLILYNIPATTHMSIPLELIDELSYHPNIVGLKDSEKDEARIKAACELWKNRSDFSHFTGWAAQSFTALKAGSDGIVPSSGNLIPEIYYALYEAVRHNDDQRAQLMQKISDEVGGLYQKGRLLGESLAALKIMLHQQGLCETYTMPPIYALSEAEETQLKKDFSAYYHHLKSILNTITAYAK